MQAIIDANIIIAMLVKPGKPIDLFFDSRLSLFAPQLLFEELGKHKEEIMEKSKLNEEEFLRFREMAGDICPDPKDVVYFALALYLNCPVWSNEKKLKEQAKIEVFATHELMRAFDFLS